MVGVGQGRDPGGWVMGARGGYSSSSVPVARCLLEAGPRLHTLSDAQEKPGVLVFMGNLWKEKRWRKSFLVRGQRWQE